MEQSRFIDLLSLTSPDGEPNFWTPKQVLEFDEFVLAIAEQAVWFSRSREQARLELVQHLRVRLADLIVYGER